MQKGDTGCRGLIRCPGGSRWRNRGWRGGHGTTSRPAADKCDKLAVMRFWPCWPLPLAMPTTSRVSSTASMPRSKLVAAWGFDKVPRRARETADAGAFDHFAHAFARLAGYRCEDASLDYANELGGTADALGPCGYAEKPPLVHWPSGHSVRPGDSRRQRPADWCQRRGWSMSSR